MPASCLLLSDPAVQQLRSPGVHRVQRPPGRGVPAPGRQLAKARATAGHNRVAWPPAQGYTESHPAAPGVPVTLCSAVEQSWYHWPGSLERLPGVRSAEQVVQQPPHLLRTPRGVWVVDVVTVGCLCFLSFYNYTQKKGGVRGQISPLPLSHSHFALSPGTDGWGEL